MGIELDSALGHDDELDVLLIDQNNYFLFPALLPSAATGTVEPRQVSFPFRRILETTNIGFRKARVEQSQRRRATGCPRPRHKAPQRLGTIRRDP